MYLNVWKLYTALESKEERIKDLGIILKIILKLNS